jgi:hypothetical protein
MCIGYTDHNKHCPKDPFPLPRIDQVIVGHTPRVLMQGRRKSRRRTPTRIPLYSY